MGLKDFLHIAVFLAAVVIGGALLAPPIYWLAQWGIAQGFLPTALNLPFGRYLHRSLFVAAFILLPVLLAFFNVRKWSSLGLAANKHPWRHLLYGWLTGLTGLAICVGLLMQQDLLVVHGPFIPFDWLTAIAIGLTVAILEELLFRGLLLGLLRRRFDTWSSLFILSVCFAAMHFVRPDMSAQSRVAWWTGLQLVPSLLTQFIHVSTLTQVLWPGFMLVLMSMTLGYVVIKTRSLYGAIGLHAGWVAALKILLGTAHVQQVSVWLAADFRSGLAPLLLVVSTWCGVVLICCVRDYGYSSMGVRKNYRPHG